MTIYHPHEALPGERREPGVSRPRPDQGSTTAADPHLAELTARPALPMELIVRCDHSLDYPSRSAGMCQLWVGHDGEHAAMFVCDGRRLVRTWLDNPAEAEDRSDDYESRPWLRGFPRPEWTE